MVVHNFDNRTSVPSVNALIPDWRLDVRTSQKHRWSNAFIYILACACPAATAAAARRSGATDHPWACKSRTLIWMMQKVIANLEIVCAFLHIFLACKNSCFYICGCQVSTCLLMPGPCFTGLLPVCIGMYNLLLQVATRCLQLHFHIGPIITVGGHPYITSFVALVRPTHSPYLSELYFSNFPVLNIKFDELDFFSSLKPTGKFFQFKLIFFSSFMARVKYFVGPCLTIYSLSTIYRDIHYQFLV